MSSISSRSGNTSRKLVDYTKCRGHGHTIEPQRNVPDDFQPYKGLHGMPTCYKLDKRVDDMLRKSRKADDIILEEENDEEEDDAVDLDVKQQQEERIDFLLKIRPVDETRRRRSSLSLLDGVRDQSDKKTMRRARSYEEVGRIKVGSIRRGSVIRQMLTVRHVPSVIKGNSIQRRTISDEISKTLRVVLAAASFCRKARENLGSKLRKQQEQCNKADPPITNCKVDQQDKKKQISRPAKFSYFLERRNENVTASYSFEKEM